MAHDSVILLDEALARYEAHLARRSISDNTRKAFLGDVHIFARYMQPGVEGQPAPGVPVSRITADHIKAFLVHQEQGGVAGSPKSIERRLTSLKVFFKWLNGAGHIALNPSEGVAYKLFLDPLPEYLSEQEASAAIGAAQMLAMAVKQELRPLTAIQLVLDTGIKKSECLNLRVMDIAFDAPGGPNVWIRYEQKRLEFKNRALSITAECAHVLRAHIDHYGCEDALFDCTGRNLEYMFNRKIASAAGLPALTFEMLRWTCAVRDFKAGALSDEQMQIKYGLSPIGWNEMQAKLARLQVQAMPMMTRNSMESSVSFSSNI